MMTVPLTWMNLPTSHDRTELTLGLVIPGTCGSACNRTWQKGLNVRL